MFHRRLCYWGPVFHRRLQRLQNLESVQFKLESDLCKLTEWIWNLSSLFEPQIPLNINISFLSCKVKNPKTYLMSLLGEFNKLLCTEAHWFVPVTEQVLWQWLILQGTRHASFSGVNLLCLIHTLPSLPFFASQKLQNGMVFSPASPLSTIWLGKILCILFCPYFAVLCLRVWLGTMWHKPISNLHGLLSQTSPKCFVDAMAGRDEA